MNIRTICFHNFKTVLRISNYQNCLLIFIIFYICYNFVSLTHSLIWFFYTVWTHFFKSISEKLCLICCDSFFLLTPLRYCNRADFRFPDQECTFCVPLGLLKWFLWFVSVCMYLYHNSKTRNCRKFWFRYFDRW